MMKRVIHRVCLVLSIAGLVGWLSACTCQGSSQSPVSPAGVDTQEQETAALAGTEDERAQQAPIPPPPKDPEARDAWLKEIAEKMPPTPPLRSMGPEGVGAFTACMDEDSIRVLSGVRLCPDTGLTARERCYTTYKTSRREDLPLELWVRDGYLSRAVSRSNQFLSPQQVGVGSTYVDVMATYATPHYLRGDEGEWIVAVSPLNTQFVLNDRHAATVDDLDPLVEVVRMETVFDCR